jgi:hypothetical protein
VVDLGRGFFGREFNHYSRLRALSMSEACQRPDEKN